MEQNELAADRGLPDLRERIDLVVGKLAIMGKELNEADFSEAQDRSAVIDEAMCLLAGLQEVIAWEPGSFRFTPEGAAAQLREMAKIGPRPPAIVTLLTDAANHLTNQERPMPDSEISIEIHAIREELIGVSERLLVSQRQLKRFSL